MRVAGVLLLALLGCRGDHRPPPAAKQPTSAPTHDDPWAVEKDVDGPPDLGERHRLANEACPSVTGAFFYRVEKGTKVSHLLGTRHIGVSLDKFPSVVGEAIDRAKLAVFETPPEEDAPFDPPKIHLREELGPELWMRYEKLVGTAAARALEHAAPATAMLAVIGMYEDIGAMLDQEIERRVVDAKIRTMGLETHEFQLALIMKLLDLRMLRAVLKQTKDRGELIEESRKSLTKYCTGTDATAGLSDETRADLMAEGYSKHELDRIEDELVYKRNYDWIPKLVELFETGDVFVAVGAGHLRGERGVVALLQKRGFKLTRITK